MEFLVISKSCLNTLMEQLFLCFVTELLPLAVSAVFPTRAGLYLNDSELKVPSSTAKSAL